MLSALLPGSPSRRTCPCRRSQRNPGTDAAALLEAESRNCPAWACLGRPQKPPTSCWQERLQGREKGARKNGEKGKLLLGKKIRLEFSFRYFCIIGWILYGASHYPELSSASSPVWTRWSPACEPMRSELRSWCRPERTPTSPGYCWGDLEPPPTERHKELDLHAAVF